MEAKNELGLICDTNMENIPYKNCMYKWSSWWWTHVRIL